MTGLIIWNIILTLVLALGALVMLGKFSRLEQDKAALIHDVNAELEAGKKWMNLLSGRIDQLLEVLQNLVTKVKTLEENHAYDNATLAGSMEQIENRIGQIYETEEGLRQDINLLLSAEKEHPVLAPPMSVPNRGGRP